MIENLLVPHDLTDYADAGFDVLRLLGSAARQVHVLHVLPRIDLETPTLVWSRDEDDARMTHGRTALQTRLAGTDCEIAVLHVRIGDPGSRIVELAKEIDADLIAMGSHGRTGMMRFVLGSVSQHVARFAPCPVLVVPPNATIRGDVPADEPVPAEDVAAGSLGPDEHADALAVDIARRVTESPGRHLTAVRIALPADVDADGVEPMLVKRLAAMGIHFVDFVFTGGARARVLTVTFEDRFV